MHSPVEETEFLLSHINLDQVNERLHWNPLPFERLYRDEWPPNQISLERPTSLTPPDTKRFHRGRPFRDALAAARTWAYHLTKFERGRQIVDNEPSIGGSDLNHDPKYYQSQYWDARAAYYEAEYHRLQEEIIDIEAPTPEEVHPIFFGATELDQAKGHAQNAAYLLQTVPAGSAYLQMEIREGDTQNPQYWKDKEMEYTRLYEALPKETMVQRARRHAESKLESLANLPGGQEWLANEEDEGGDPNSAQHWERKETRYVKAFDYLRELFWMQRKSKYGREPPSGGPAQSWLPPAITSSVPDSKGSVEANEGAGGACSSQMAASISTHNEGRATDNPEPCGHGPTQSSQDGLGASFCPWPMSSQQDRNALQTQQGLFTPPDSPPQFRSIDGTPKPDSPALIRAFLTPD